MKTKTETLIKALRILANDIESEDGVANAAIAEGAQRLEELHEMNKNLLDVLIEADSMIEMEPYEHVSQEASDAHQNIRETIRKAKGESHA